MLKKPEIKTNNIRELPNVPNMPTDELKYKWDAVGEDIVNYLNELIDELSGAGGAGGVGAGALYVGDESTADVQSKLMRLKEMIDSTNKAMADILLDPRILPYGSVTADKLAPNIVLDEGGWGDDGQDIDTYNPYDFKAVGFGLDAKRVNANE